MAVPSWQATEVLKLGIATLQPVNLWSLKGWWKGEGIDTVPRIVPWLGLIGGGGKVYLPEPAPAFWL